MSLSIADDKHELLGSVESLATRLFHNFSQLEIKRVEI